MIRRFQLIVIAAILLIAAFSTELELLFYLVYLSILVIGGSYILTRLGLADLEAGYAVNQLTGHVGDRLQITYTLRNTSRLPKPWLEVHNPTTLPGGLPGRAIALGPRAERSWLVRAPLFRRGHFRVEPLQIRTGDPFGFFEASASVGQGVAVVVYPRVDKLPLWRLPAASIEGSHSAAERTLQTSPLATAVRPYAPGDSFNRIHWRSTARHGEIQVKEFEVEQTADAWIFLDLERAVQGGRGEESTVEMAVRAAASIADKALLENRAVGLTVNGHRQAMVPADRGGRQHLKIMQLLAAVDGDGATSLAESLIGAAGRLRRGMTAIVITPSLDPAWIRPIAALRTRGIASVVVTLDAAAADAVERTERRRAGETVHEPTDAAGEQRAQRARALRHALAEYELRVHALSPGRSLAESLGG
jgi:uncharacterized protein (DUF58 family)